jgi:hypothetical protein
MPRLPPSTSADTINITMGEKMVPYLTAWYQDKRKAGESKSSFIERALRKQVQAYWIETYGQSSLAADAALLSSEM